MRAHQTVLRAAMFLITLSMIVPLLPAADIQEAEPAGAIPANDTILSTVAAHGTSAPLSSFEKGGKVTLFRFELNQTTFPGPRSMAFGPRYIQVTTSPATVTVFCSGVFVGGAVVYILNKRKKAKEIESVTTDEEAEEDQKKGE